MNEYLLRNKILQALTIYRKFYKIWETSKHPNNFGADHVVRNTK